MTMIPDTSPPAQPVELYRVDVFIDETRTHSETVTATTDEEINATALGIVTAQGGDYGDIYQHNGAGGGTYYGTVGVE